MPVQALQCKSEIRKLERKEEEGRLIDVDKWFWEEKGLVINGKARQSVMSFSMEKATLLSWSR